MADMHDDFWARHEGRSLFVKSAEKKQLVADETIFEIAGVETAEGRYGPQWSILIVLDNEQRILTFASTQARDEFFEDLHTELQQSSEMVRAKLVSFDASNGMTGYALAMPS